jgi:hypothetical protein
VESKKVYLIEVESKMIGGYKRLRRKGREGKIDQWVLSYN